MLSPRSFSALVALAAVLSGCASRQQVTAPLPTVAPVRSAEFRQTLGSVLSYGFVGGNRIETLENGNEIFPAMLAAIRQARRTVNFETFVFYKGEIPEAFVTALCERAQAGVRVQAIIDGFGGSKSRRYHGRLRDAGVQLAIFHPVLWPDIRRTNHRTHRKLLIVDGKIGFIGGVGIADEWAGNARSPEEWRDLHYRVQGPIVAQLQGTFHDNWRKTGGEVLQGPDYFPPLPPAGNLTASVFYSSPRHNRSQVELMYHLVIASAQRSLLVANAYFLPDDAMVDAFCAAARRGVRVRILMPGEHMDQKAVRRGSRKRWPKLLAAGVELYEYAPTMLHSKLLIADGAFVSLGSSNFDPRSLRINDEANMNVLDAGFAAEQTRIFEKDLRRAIRVPRDRRKTEELSELPLQAVQTPVESQL